MSQTVSIQNVFSLFSSQQILEFVTAPGASPLAMSMDLPDDVDQCEICPDAGVIMSCISQNIHEHGGCSLIVDYGVEKSDRFSLRVRSCRVEL